MKRIFVVLIGVMLAAGRLFADTNQVPQIADTTNTADTATNDPVEAELDLLMADDDAAMDQVDQWIRDNNAATANGGGVSREDLNNRINARLDGVRHKYEDFLKRNPGYAPGHLAYGSFLESSGKEDLASVEYETASKLDPKNPAAWNDLANYYGENGPLTNAFTDYQKAIDLDPSEPVYYQNLATIVYVYRRDAMSFYQITEPQVFDKALNLYRKAVKLDPGNFELATDYAETYYGIRPLRTNDALVAWTNTLSAAQNDVDREGVYIHLARLKTVAGRYDEARAQLLAVTNLMYADLKNRLERNIVAREHPQTNAAPHALQGANIPAMLITNVVPALTNSPILSSNTVSVLANVPPTSPAPAQLTDTNPPVNPTNLLNNLEVTPPAPRALPDQ